MPAQWDGQDLTEGRPEGFPLRSPCSRDGGQEEVQEGVHFRADDLGLEPPTVPRLANQGNPHIFWVLARTSYLEVLSGIGPGPFDLQSRGSAPPPGLLFFSPAVPKLSATASRRAPETSQESRRIRMEKPPTSPMHRTVVLKGSCGPASQERCPSKTSREMKNVKRDARQKLSPGERPAPAYRLFGCERELAGLGKGFSGNIC